MSKIRTEIAEAVASQLIPAKRHAVEASAAAFNTVATLLAARARAREGPNFGADILALAREAANASFDAQDRLHQVHALVAPIRDAWQIPPGAYGPNDTKKVVFGSDEQIVRLVDTQAA